ncbi:MAG TPA: hypothetical protein VLK58_21500 [Conexibacter sp.]|nr:hypothetical protein [Conexibacter sp.]
MADVADRLAAAGDAVDDDRGSVGDRAGEQLRKLSVLVAVGHAFDDEHEVVAVVADELKPLAVLARPSGRDRLRGVAAVVELDGAVGRDGERGDDDDAGDRGDRVDGAAVEGRLGPRAVGDRIAENTTVPATTIATPGRMSPMSRRPTPIQGVAVAIAYGEIGPLLRPTLCRRWPR